MSSELTACNVHKLEEQLGDAGQDVPQHGSSGSSGTHAVTSSRFRPQRVAARKAASCILAESASGTASGSDDFDADAERELSPPPKRAPVRSSKGAKLPRPTEPVACPRCSSDDTKFCYYNNYNVKQPRYYCKACQRYWTEGGMLRNVPVGAGRRKHKAARSGEGESEAAHSSRSGAAAQRQAAAAQAGSTGGRCMQGAAACDMAPGAAMAAQLAGGLPALLTSEALDGFTGFAPYGTVQTGGELALPQHQQAIPGEAGRSESLGADTCTFRATSPLLCGAGQPDGTGLDGRRVRARLEAPSVAAAPSQAAPPQLQCPWGAAPLQHDAPVLAGWATGAEAMTAAANQMQQAAALQAQAQAQLNAAWAPHGAGSWTSANPYLLYNAASPNWTGSFGMGQPGELPEASDCSSLAALSALGDLQTTFGLKQGASDGFLGLDAMATKGSDGSTLSNFILGGASEPGA